MAAAAELQRRYAGAEAATIAVRGAATTAATGSSSRATCTRRLGGGGVPDRRRRRLTADARANFDIARRLDVPVHERVAPARLKRGVRRADVLVDALLGTGFTGVPRPGAARADRGLAARAGPVVALDVPSGVDSSTGRRGAQRSSADLTSASTPQGRR